MLSICIEITAIFGGSPTSLWRRGDSPEKHPTTLPRAIGWAVFRSKNGDFSVKNYPKNPRFENSDLLYSMLRIEIDPVSPRRRTLAAPGAAGYLAIR